MKKEKGIPTISEMVDIELSVPNVSVGGFDNAKQIEQWFKTLMKKIDKLFQRHSKNMTDNNESTDCLLLFLEKYPELFANEYGEINRDMIKWALNENIKKNRALIDKIQKIENELKLPIHQKW